MKPGKNGEVRAGIGETEEQPKEPQSLETTRASYRKNMVVIKQSIKEIEFLHSIFLDKSTDTK